MTALHQGDNTGRITGCLPFTAAFWRTLGFSKDFFEIFFGTPRYSACRRVPRSGACHDETDESEQ
jgi:hypothetical protein